jgi:hypothetical protein
MANTEVAVRSSKQSCRLKPGTKGAIEITMEIGECVQKPAQDGPGGGFIRLFLMDCLDIRLALTPYMLSMVDARGKSILVALHTMSKNGKDLKE